MTAPTNIVDRVREMLRQLEPAAREHLGKSILDCDEADRDELRRHIHHRGVALLAELDQCSAITRDIADRYGLEPPDLGEGR